MKRGVPATRRSAKGSERNVAFLGGGRMGEALVSGLLRSGGRSPDELMVTGRREERVRELGDHLGVTATLSKLKYCPS